MLHEPVRLTQNRCKFLNVVSKTFHEANAAESNLINYRKMKLSAIDLLIMCLNSVKKIHQHSSPARGKWKIKSYGRANKSTI